MTNQDTHPLSMIKRFTVWIMTLTALFTGTTLFAADIYVRVDGSDETGNGTEQNPYKTLVHAVAQAASDDVIHLQSDLSGDGIVINKDLTIDFAGKTYTISGEGVGSSGTETNGFQLLIGNTILFKDGTIKVAETAHKKGDSAKPLKLIIQNYSNLTLNNMTVDANGLGSINYALSLNNGAVALTGNTSITVTEGNVAFDVSYWPSMYPYGAQITVNTTGTITGNIEMGIYGANGSLPAGPSTTTLTVKNINHVGAITTYAPTTGDYDTGKTEEENTAMFNEMTDVSGGTFSARVQDAYLADGFVQEVKTDGTYGVFELVIQKQYYFAENGTGDGLTLTTAANPAFLQQYINACDADDNRGVTMHVAAGTYSTADGISFPIKLYSGVTIEGSVDGQGDPTTIFDAAGAARVMISEKMSAATLETFKDVVTSTDVMAMKQLVNEYAFTYPTPVSNLILKNGAASGAYAFGGGIAVGANCTLTNIKVENCKLPMNDASIGGGIFAAGATLNNCEISGCEQYQSALQLYGATATNCTIRNNTMSYDQAVSAWGCGTLAAGDGLYSTIENSIITGNTAGHSTAGIGVRNSYVRGCEITDNKVDAATSYASAMYAFGECVVERNTISGNYGCATVITTSPKSNQIVGGGGMCPEYAKNVTFQNNLVTGNTATNTAPNAVFAYIGESANVINNTFAGNTGKDLTVADGLTAGVIENNIFASTTASVVNSADLVKYNAFTTAVAALESTTNVAGDMKLAADYTLTSESPAIDRGIEAGAPAKDFTDADRKSFGGVFAVEGEWNSKVDAGCYEYLGDAVITPSATTKSFAYGVTTAQESLYTDGLSLKFGSREVKPGITYGNFALQYVKHGATTPVYAYKQTNEETLARDVYDLVVTSTYSSYTLPETKLESILTVGTCAIYPVYTIPTGDALVYSAEEKTATAILYIDEAHTQAITLDHTIEYDQADITNVTGNAITATVKITEGADNYAIVGTATPYTIQKYVETLTATQHDDIASGDEFIPGTPTFKDASKLPDPLEGWTLSEVTVPEFNTNDPKQYTVNPTYSHTKEGNYAITTVSTTFNVNGEAQIGDVEYPTLAAAVAAANAGDTVELLRDAKGPGIIIDKSLTIDFGGHKYTVNGRPVGSFGTETSGFQVLKEAGDVTFQNGTIDGDGTQGFENAKDPPQTKYLKMLVQNYANLTLNGITLDGAGLNMTDNAAARYTLSNNNGNILIKNSTIKACVEPGYNHIAFDVYNAASTNYPSVSVTVENSTIVGVVEVDGGAEAARETCQLNISGEGTDMSHATLTVKDVTKAAVIATADNIVNAAEKTFWHAEGDPVEYVLRSTTAVVTFNPGTNVTNLKYDGSQHKTTVSSVVYKGTTVAVEDARYTVTADGDFTNVGTHTLTVANKEGSTPVLTFDPAVATVTIIPREVNLTIAVATDFVYDGTSKGTAGVTQVDYTWSADGNTVTGTLAVGTDYIVALATGANDVNAGMYQVVVSPVDGSNYTFDATTSGDIVIEKYPLTVTVDDRTLKFGEEFVAKNLDIPEKLPNESTISAKDAAANYTAGETGIGTYKNAVTAEMNWDIYNKNNYAVTATPKDLIVTSPWDGDGTEGNPYLLTNRADFDALSLAVNGGNTFADSFFKVAPIAPATAIDMGTENFTPIAQVVPVTGGTADSTPFMGTLDGDSKPIQNLIISNTIGALFGIVENATLKNLIIDNARINGQQMAAGLVDSIMGNDGTVTNCGVINSTITSNIYTASFAGENSGRITGCYAENNTVSGSLACGFVSTNYGTIEKSYANVEITGTDFAAGFVTITSGTIRDCYTVSTFGENANAQNKAAFVREIDKTGSIERCYTTMDGKFYEDADAAARLEQNFILGGATLEQDGVTPYTASQMISYAFATDSMLSGAESAFKFVPGQYPALTWEDRSVEKVAAKVVFESTQRSFEFDGNGHYPAVKEVILDREATTNFEADSGTIIPRADYTTYYTDKAAAPSEMHIGYVQKIENVHAAAYEFTQNAVLFDIYNPQPAGDRIYLSANGSGDGATRDNPANAGKYLQNYLKFHEIYGTDTIVLLPGTYTHGENGLKYPLIIPDSVEVIYEGEVVFDPIGNPFAIADSIYNGATNPEHKRPSKWHAEPKIQSGAVVINAAADEDSGFGVTEICKGVSLSGITYKNCEGKVLVANGGNFYSNRITESEGHSPIVQLSNGATISNSIIDNNNNGYIAIDETSVMINCTVVKNTYTQEPAEEFIVKGEGSVYNTLFAANWTNNCDVNLTNGEGNMGFESVDTCYFVDAANDNFALTYKSPMIDAANQGVYDGNAVAWELPINDFANETRIKACDPERTVYSNLDVGAYEFQDVMILYDAVIVAKPAPEVKKGYIVDGSKYADFATLTQMMGASRNRTDLSNFEAVLSFVSTKDPTVIYKNGEALPYGSYYARWTTWDYLTPTLPYEFEQGLTAVSEYPAIHVLPWDGEGTEESPYLLTCREDFDALSDFVNGFKRDFENTFFMIAPTAITIDETIIQTTAYINMGKYSDGTAASSFEPIGVIEGQGNVVFQGIIKGNGKRLDNLSIDKEQSSGVGLFGTLGEKAIIEQFGLASATVKGLECVGGFAGTNHGTIRECRIRGVITSTDGYAGGIVGANDGGTITDCYAAQTNVIKGNSGGYCGGLVGSNNGTMTNVYAIGSIPPTNSGKLIGWNMSSGEVTNAFIDSARYGDHNAINVNQGTADVNLRETKFMIAYVTSQELGASFLWQPADYPILAWEAPQMQRAVDVGFTPEGTKLMYDGQDHSIKPRMTVSFDGSVGVTSTSVDIIDVDSIYAPKPFGQWIEPDTYTLTIRNNKTIMTADGEKDAFIFRLNDGTQVTEATDTVIIYLPTQLKEIWLTAGDYEQDYDFTEANPGPAAFLQYMLTAGKPGWGLDTIHLTNDAEFTQEAFNKDIGLTLPILTQFPIVLSNGVNLIGQFDEEAWYSWYSTLNAEEEARVLVSGLADTEPTLIQTMAIVNGYADVDYFADTIGGAGAIVGANITMEDVGFYRNSTDDGCGGAVYSRGATFVGCEFSMNFAGDGRDFAGGFGGALYAEEGTQVYNTYFTGNSVDSQGGTIYANGAVTIKDCDIRYGYAPSGAAIYGDNAIVDNCHIYLNDVDDDNPYQAIAMGGAYTNCLFRWNVGGVGGHATLINCTLADNNEEIIVVDSSVSIYNTLIVGNVADPGVGVSRVNNLVYANFDDAHFVGVINGDWPAQSYSLTAQSYAIDSGLDVIAGITVPTSDIEGVEAVRVDPSAFNGTNKKDIGCFEYKGPATAIGIDYVAFDPQPTADKNSIAPADHTYIDSCLVGATFASRPIDSSLVFLVTDSYRTAILGDDHVVLGGAAFDVGGDYDAFVHIDNARTPYDFGADSVCTVESVVHVWPWNRDEDGNFMITCDTDLRILAIEVNDFGQTFEGDSFIIVPDQTIAGQEDGLAIVMDKTKAFAPIGNSQSSGFRGTFNGNGKAIKNLNIADAVGTDDDGLFGSTIDATLKNILLINVSYDGTNDYVGGLVASARNTLITGCAVKGATLKTTGHTVGGLVGIVYGTTRIENGYTQITEIQSANAVTTGLLVGNCVNGQPSVYSINNVYSVGPAQMFGGDPDGNIITNAYYDKDVYQDVNNDDAFGKTTTEMFSHEFATNTMGDSIIWQPAGYPLMVYESPVQANVNVTYDPASLRFEYNGQNQAPIVAVTTDSGVTIDPADYATTIPANYIPGVYDFSIDTKYEIVNAAGDSQWAFNFNDGVLTGVSLAKTYEIFNPFEGLDEIWLAAEVEGSEGDFTADSPGSASKYFQLALDSQFITGVDTIHLYGGLYDNDVLDAPIRIGSGVNVIGETTDSALNKAKVVIEIFTEEESLLTSSALDTPTFWKNITVNGVAWGAPAIVLDSNITMIDVELFVGSSDTVIVMNGNSRIVGSVISPILGSSMIEFANDAQRAIVVNSLILISEGLNSPDMLKNLIAAKKDGYGNMINCTIDLGAEYDNPFGPVDMFAINEEVEVGLKLNVLGNNLFLTHQMTVAVDAADSIANMFVNDAFEAGLDADYALTDTSMAIDNGNTRIVRLPVDFFVNPRIVAVDPLRMAFPDSAVDVGFAEYQGPAIARFDLTDSFTQEQYGFYTNDVVLSEVITIEPSFASRPIPVDSFNYVPTFTDTTAALNSFTGFDLLDVGYYTLSLALNSPFYNTLGITELNSDSVVLQVVPAELYFVSNTTEGYIYGDTVGLYPRLPSQDTAFFDYTDSADVTTTTIVQATYKWNADSAMEYPTVDCDTLYKIDFVLTDSDINNFTVAADTPAARVIVAPRKVTIVSLDGTEMLFVINEAAQIMHFDVIDLHDDAPIHPNLESVVVNPNVAIAAMNNEPRPREATFTPGVFGFTTCVVALDSIDPAVRQNYTADSVIIEIAVAREVQEVPFHHALEFADLTATDLANGAVYKFPPYGVFAAQARRDYKLEAEIAGTNTKVNGVDFEYGYTTDIAGEFAEIVADDILATYQGTDGVKYIVRVTLRGFDNVNMIYYKDSFIRQYMIVDYESFEGQHIVHVSPEGGVNPHDGLTRESAYSFEEMQLMSNQGLFADSDYQFNIWPGVYEGFNLNFGDELKNLEVIGRDTEGVVILVPLTEGNPPLYMPNVNDPLFEIDSQANVFFTKLTAKGARKFAGTQLFVEAPEGTLIFEDCQIIDNSFIGKPRVIQAKSVKFNRGKINDNRTDR